MKEILILIIVVLTSCMSNSQVFWDAQCDGNLHSPIYITDNFQCNNGTYILAYEDNFSAPTLDNIMWKTSYDWGNFLVGNNESAIYTPNNHVIEDEKIKLFANDQSTYGKVVEWKGNAEILSDGLQNYRQFDHTSGMIFSSKEFGYGKYEALVKIPKGKGFWPAFWTYGGSEGPFGNDYGEIDIFEFWTEKNMFGTYDPLKLAKIVHTNTHHNFFQVSDPTTNYSCGRKHDLSIDYSTSFHKFTMIYDEFKIEWYVDDILIRRMYFLFTGGTIVDPIECYEYSTSNQGFGYRLNRAYPKFPNAHIILNLAIQDDSDGNGPDGDTDFSNMLEIEYVRFYKQVPCVDDVTILTNSVLNLSHDNFNFLAGDHVTIGGNVTVHGQWVSNSYYDGQLNISAKTEITLSPGLTIPPNSSFSASIDNHLCSTKSLNSDDEKHSNDDFKISEMQEKWIMYPNPSEGLLYFKSNRETTNETYSVTVTDATGRTCLEQPIRSTYGQIDVSEMSRGSYIVVIKNGSGDTIANEIILVK